MEGRVGLKRPSACHFERWGGDGGGKIPSWLETRNIGVKTSHFERRGDANTPRLLETRGEGAHWVKKVDKEGETTWLSFACQENKNDERTLCARLSSS